MSKCLSEEMHLGWDQILEGSGATVGSALLSLSRVGLGEAREAIASVLTAGSQCSSFVSFSFPTCILHRQKELPLVFPKVNPETGEGGDTWRSECEEVAGGHAQPNTTGTLLSL